MDAFRPIGPETTCIGPRSSRQAPTLIRGMPLRPVGNRAACHPNSARPSAAVILLRRVEHHFDHAFDIAVGSDKATRVHAEFVGRLRIAPRLC